MYVDTRFQGEGVAQLLMDMAIHWAKENDCSAIRLESDNTLKRAHHFYEKSGFVLYELAYKKEINIKGI